MNQQWRYYYQHYPYTQNHLPGYTSYPSPYKQMDQPLARPEYEEQCDKKQVEQPYYPPLGITEHIEKLYEKLIEMENETKEIKEEIENIKPITIENINYKIQDLNVEDLSGTLLVGLTALSDAENLKELLSENGSVKFNDQETEDFENNFMNNQEANEPNNNQDNS
ncbi:spore germination protein GerPC [Virgibacillus sp. C22-A2]|uniref:Spore germination protein GerPC n=1 Tax=Virgibacillus tibetensis TaxID=3042313 RepID=A0ABU6KJM6_9BACI|nr:spore germination protein GerPC [Virgibacillus sp. C22-A2]